MRCKKGAENGNIMGRTFLNKILVEVLVVKNQKKRAKGLEHLVKTCKVTP